MTLPRVNTKYFVLCERDAGLFSLIQQVVSNLPRAFNLGRVPVVCFGSQCCYWVAGGHRGAHSVWEYYFEPVIPGVGCGVVPTEVRAFAKRSFPDGGTVGRSWDETFYVSNNFGDHPQLRTKVLVIPFKWTEPDDWIREVASKLMTRFVRPRSYLMDRAEAFAREHFTRNTVIGVHVRGTDALHTDMRRTSLDLNRFETAIGDALVRFPQARIFVCTDDERSLRCLRETFGDRLLAMPTLRHTAGDVVSSGPTGAIMPAYIARDPHLAVQNGEDALVEWLLLLRCRMLIHNGSSLARTVVLRDPAMEHVNTHRPDWKERVIAWRPLAWVRGWHVRLMRKRIIRYDTWRQAGLW